MLSPATLFKSLSTLAGINIPPQFPPGPRTLETAKIYLKFQKDPLTAYTFLHQKYGDTVGLYGIRKVVFAFNPKDIEHVLKTNHKNYLKSDSYKELYPLLGHGLVTSEGELWRRERLLVAKEFHQESIKNYFPVMKQQTQLMLAKWDYFEQKNIYFDLSEQMMGLTFEIAGSTLFGENLGEKAAMVREALTEMTELAIKRILKPIRIPYSFPLPSHRSAFNKLQKLDQMVYQLMDGYAQKNQDEKKSNNVLAKLMSVPDMPRSLLRDEIMTLLMAGHETTSNALTWTFYLLALHPDIQEKVHQEITSICLEKHLSRGDWDMETLQKLTYTKAVLQESMRLYPPVPVISRNTIETDEVGGYIVPAHTIVATIPFVTHRDPANFKNPLEFLPERFLPKNIDQIKPYSYFPFAAGPRRCIGEDFAMIESLLVLTMVLEKYVIKLRKGFVPKPAGNITLRSLNGMWVGVERVSN